MEKQEIEGACNKKSFQRASAEGLLDTNLPELTVVFVDVINPGVLSWGQGGSQKHMADLGEMKTLAQHISRLSSIQLI